MLRNTSDPKMVLQASKTQDQSCEEAHPFPFFKEENILRLAMSIMRGENFPFLPIDSKEAIKDKFSSLSPDYTHKLEKLRSMH